MTADLDGPGPKLDPEVQCRTSAQVTGVGRSAAGGDEALRTGAAAEPLKGRGASPGCHRAGAIAAGLAASSLHFGGLEREHAGTCKHLPHFS